MLIQLVTRSTRPCGRITSPMMVELGYSSKMLAEWAFFQMLRDEGRRVADEVLGNHAGDLGVNSTLDLNEMLDFE